MSYPAYQAFTVEYARSRASSLWRVYLALQPPTLDFVQTKEIKTSTIAHDLGMGRQHVAAAIERLIASEYVIEEGRGDRGVRKLRLVFARPKLLPSAHR